MRFTVAVLLVLLAVEFVTAVPPTYTNFNPRTNSKKYGLVVSDDNSNFNAARFLRQLATQPEKAVFSTAATNTEAASASSMTVLPYEEIELLNLTSKVKATAWFNASIQQIGWDYLHVIGGASNTPQDWYYSGAIEGALTVRKLLETRPRTVANFRRLRDDLQFRANNSAVLDFVVKQIQWTAQRALNGSTAGDAYWTQVYRHLAQLQGIVDGGNTQLFNLPLLDFMLVYSINLDMEWSAIENAVATQRKPTKKSAGPSLVHETVKPTREQQHCSALVKRVGNSELYTSQVVWGPMEVFNLYRYMKILEFGDVRVTFSSYPAFIHSADDWYKKAVRNTSSGNSGFVDTQVIQETTIGNYNVSLWKRMSAEKVSEFIRAQTANFINTGGQNWMELYSRNNNGAYNNQWMVVTYPSASQAATPTTLPDTLPAGTLWLVEQAVEQIFGKDITDETLNNNSAGNYFASYNIPMLPQTRQATGFDAMGERYPGGFFSFSECPRAKIFRRMQRTISTNLATMQNVMRYNDFQHDPDSIISPQECAKCPGAVCNPKHSAMFAVASRGDLNPKASNSSVCYGSLAGYVGHQSFGGLDSKVAVWSQRAKQQIHAISGPTNVQQPTWEFTKENWVPIVPRSYKFPWVTFEQP